MSEERMVTVRIGSGKDRTTERMPESEFQKRFRSGTSGKAKTRGGRQAGGSGGDSAVETTTEAGAFSADYPGFDVLGQVEGMTPEKIAGMSDEDVLKINGIGPATLKAIRAYGK